MSRAWLNAAKETTRPGPMIAELIKNLRMLMRRPPGGGAPL
jgi:hypothetical protein